MIHFEQLPAIIRVLAVFCVMLYAIRRKFSIGNAFLGGALLLGLIFSMTPVTILRSLGSSFTHPKTLSLSLVVLLILVLSHSLELTGQMERLLNCFQGLVARPRINLVVFPALIGLLPMPGGAIFSAPMVKTIASDMDLDSEQLSYVNYWFRHIWEYWWPLYPGVLLTTALANLDLWVFVFSLFPLTVVSVLSGYASLGFSRPTGKIEKTSSQPDYHPSINGFLLEILPILIVIILGLGIGAILTDLLSPPLKAISKELGLVLSLMVSIGWVWHANHLNGQERWAIIKRRQLVRLFYMVAAILMFKGILDDSQAVSLISRELIDLKIPLFSITIALPFLVGGVSGITIAFVGATFPILISLIQAYGETGYMLAYMMLALTCGFVGVLLSPLHLCLLLSNEYFETRLAPVYRYLWVPCITLLSVGCLYFWGLHALIKAS